MALKDQDVITALVRVLSHRQNGTSAVPDLYRGNGSLPVPQRPGLLTRLFDRTGAARDGYQHKQLLVILETELKALQIEAEGYVETVQLTTESKVRVHAHKLTQQEAVLKKEAEALAVIDLHAMQQRLLKQIAEMGLDPTEEAFVIAKVVTACMAKDKENRNGHNK